MQAFRIRTIGLSQLVLAVLVAVAGVMITPPGGTSQAVAAAESQREVVEERTRFSNTFEVGNGVFKTVVSASPVNFRVGVDAWQPIDSRILPTADSRWAWTNAANTLDVSFARSAGSAISRLTLRDREYVLSLDGARDVTTEISGATATYRDVLPSVDLEYVVLPDGLKETLFLKDAGASTAYTFRLTLPAGPPPTLHRRPNGSWLLVPRSGEPLVIGAPVVEEERARKGSTSTGTGPESVPTETPADGDEAREPSGRPARTLARIDDRTLVLTLSIDPSWLASPDRQFPIRIDPTVTVGGGGMDANFRGDCSSCASLDPYGTLRVGTTSSAVWRSALQFDLESLPTSANVQTATLNLRYSQGCLITPCGASAHQLDLHTITAPWQPGTLPSALSYDSGVADSFTLPVSAAQQWMSWDVTSETEDWLNGVEANYGFLVKRATEALSAGGPLAGGFDHANPPTLEVTYTSDAVVLEVPSLVRSNGADLRWTQPDGSTGNPFESYEIHRSTNPTFSPSPASLIATITDVQTTSFVDTTAAAATSFTYRVVTNGAASRPRSVATPAAGLTTQTIKLSPSPLRAITIVDYVGPCYAEPTGDLTVGMYWSEGALTQRSLLAFDLRNVPQHAQIQSATLSLFTEVNDPSVTVEAHRLNSDWTASGEPDGCLNGAASFYKRKSGVNWEQPGGDFDPTIVDTVVSTGAPEWHEFEIAEMVEGWKSGENPNHGLLLKAEDDQETASGYVFYGDSLLEITYSDGNSIVSPTISIAEPTGGTWIDGTETILAATSDDSAVASVQFFVDNTLASTDVSSPFAFEWNTTSASRGSHSLHAVATDNAGNPTTSSSVQVFVDNTAAPEAEITSPLLNAVVSGNVSVTADATDDIAVEHVEFYVDGNRFTDTAISPYTATLDTDDPDAPIFDGVHTLTVKAYDEGGHVTTSDEVEITVSNRPSASIYAGTIVAADVPRAITYDPGASTQTDVGFAVTVTNTSGSTWLASDVALRYRWISAGPTPTVIDGADVPLTANLASGLSQILNLTVPPPALPDGVSRSQYTLRVDLHDDAGNTYFADKGNQPLDNPVIVNKALVSNALGLERYYHYVGQELGGGMQQLTNVANGNSLLRWTPFEQPGVGLASVLDLTYNSLEAKCSCPAGNNWSLSISSLTRFGEPIDIHPNNADQIPGNSNKYIDFTDGDGTSHRFTDANSDGYWEAPPGVNLYLRVYSTTDAARKWALTRPDGITFFYNANGYPTFVSDRNDNELTFTLATPAPADDPGGPGKQITAVTDAEGRSFTLTYYTKADAKKSHIRGRVKRITDHAGRGLRFEYYHDGNLLRITQEGGTNADGTPLSDRTFVFTYTTSSGSGAAITSSSARVDPAPHTPNQSTRLYSVRDPRGHETLFTYLGSGAGTSRWKLESLTDRDANETSFTYDTVAKETTVARPLSRTSSYAYDTDGKVTTITNPLNQATTVSWTGDFNVDEVVEPGGATTAYEYNANGYMTSVTDAVGKTTALTYENLPIDGKDTTTYWESGRSIPHLSQLATLTSPRGTATPSPTDDFQWSFTYDADGNLTEAVDPLGNDTTNEYNADGTLAVAADGNGNETLYSSYDDNGYPTAIADPLANTTTLSYSADGRLLWLRDPNHQSVAATSPSNATYFYYDSFGRLGGQSTPKSTEAHPGLLLWTSASYDANDNVVSYMGARQGTSDGRDGNITTIDYNELDQATLVTGPDTSADPAGERTAYIYDAAGRLTSETRPKGVESSTANDYSTGYAYDLLDRVSSSTAYPATGLTTGARVTNYCYDLAGDRRSVTTPRGASGFSGCPAATTPYAPSTDAFTWAYTYDAAHRILAQIDPATRSQSVTYDADGNMATATDAASVTTTYAYDASGRLQSETQPFDTTVSPVRNLVTRYEHDAAGNLKRLISPRAYDAASGGPTFTDYVTEYQYDDANRVIRVDLPTDSSTDPAFIYYGYDDNGQATTITLPTATAMAPGSIDLDQISTELKTRVTYFDTGWIRSSRNPGQNRVEFDYTPEGWQSSRTPHTAEDAPNIGKRILWGYAPDGQLTSIADGDETTTARTAYTYDANNNLLTASEGRGVVDVEETPLAVQASYDGFDQITKVRQRRLAESDYTVSTYGYDLNGNLDARTQNGREDEAGDPVAAGAEQEFFYHANDWLDYETYDGTTAGLAGDQKVTFTHNNTGQLASKTIAYPAGGGTWTTKQVTTGTYFANGLPKTLVTKNGSNVTLESHTYAYLEGSRYENGQKTGDEFFMARPSTGTPICSSTTPCEREYDYNAQGRLTGYVDGRGNTTTYTLDAAGNIATKAVSGSAPTTTSFTYSGLRLETQSGPGAAEFNFFYDDDGSLDCVTTAVGTDEDCIVGDGGASQELVSRSTFDYRGRLQAHRAFGGTPTTSRYINDALDRLSKQVNTPETGSATSSVFSYIGLERTLSREVAFEDTTEQGTNSYHYDAFGRRSGMTLADGSSTARFTFSADAKSSVGLLIDSNGVAKSSYAYGPYGDAEDDITDVASSFEDPNPFRYEGRRIDSASGTLDMGARRFQPDVARFTQIDQYSGALDDLGLSTDPLTANRYAFAGGSPTSFVETDGHKFKADAGIGQGGTVPKPKLKAPTSSGSECVNGGKGCQFAEDFKTGFSKGANNLRDSVVYTVKNPKQAAKNLHASSVAMWNCGSTGQDAACEQFEEALYGDIKECYHEDGVGGALGCAYVPILAGAATGATGKGIQSLRAAPRPVPTIHWDKQAKHFPGHQNYIPNRSPLTADPRKLVQRAGTGDPIGSIPRGQAGFSERIDYGQIIGRYSTERGVSVPTSVGIIHYAADGSVHIVPGRPSRVR